MIDHSAGEFGISDADAEPGELVGAEVLDDRAHPVMPPGGALTADAQATEGEGDVIIDHQDLGRFDAVEVGDLGDRLAAQIHEGLRLDDVFPMPEAGDVRDPTLRVLECFARILGQLLDDEEADVVPGVGIFWPRVSEADNKA